MVANLLLVGSVAGSVVGSVAGSIVGSVGLVIGSIVVDPVVGCMFESGSGGFAREKMSVSDKNSRWLGPAGKQIVPLAVMIEMSECVADAKSVQGPELEGAGNDKIHPDPSANASA